MSDIDSGEQEMTLDEWCCRLPDGHKVNKELRELRERTVSEVVDEHNACAIPVAMQYDLAAWCDEWAMFSPSLDELINTIAPYFEWLQEEAAEIRRES